MIHSREVVIQNGSCLKIVNAHDSGLVYTHLRPTNKVRLYVYNLFNEHTYVRTIISFADEVSPIFRARLRDHSHVLAVVRLGRIVPQ